MGNNGFLSSEKYFCYCFFTNKLTKHVNCSVVEIWRNVLSVLNNKSAKIFRCLHWCIVMLWCSSFWQLVILLWLKRKWSFYRKAEFCNFSVFICIRKSVSMQCSFKRACKYLSLYIIIIFVYWKSRFQTVSRYIIAIVLLSYL